MQVLRALAAASVVLGHIMAAAVRVQPQGGAFRRPDLPTGAGVDLFFVISGFVMVLSSQRLLRRADGPADFMLRRIVRIVPLYWCVTTLTLILAAIGHHRALPGLAAIAASYGFIPYDTTAQNDGFAYPVVDLGWTLNYEMLFYLLFAASMRVGRQRCVPIVSIVLAGLVLIGALWPPTRVALHFWTRPIMLEFVIGMWLARWFQSGRLVLPGSARVALAVAALAALAWNPLPALHLPTTPNEFDRLAGWGLPVTALLTAAIAGPMALRSPLGPFAVLLGGASFALYLTHPFALLVLDRLQGRLPIVRDNAYVFLTLGMTGAILLAVGVYIWFERPITGALTRRLRCAEPHIVPPIEP